jgi:short-subunit dehydrogenase
MISDSERRAESRRLVLITGASGGIGEAFANVVSEDGVDLILVSRNEGELNRVRGLVAAKFPKRNISVMALDLAEADAGARLAGELKERQLVPDVLINNAGYGLFGRTAELPYEEQIGIVDLNIRALTDLTLRLLPAMVANKSGGVLNVASTAAFMPGPFMSLYYASKAYVLSFSEALAAELAHSGVTVTVLCPGPVPTGFQTRAQMKSMKFMGYVSSLSADEVARAGWEGFKQHRRIVVPGTLNKAAAYAGRYAPRWLTLPVMRFLQTPPQARGSR